MPWPPTGFIEPNVDIGDQVASPVTPGVESPVGDPASVGLSYDPQTGVVAPGVGVMWEPDFSALPDPEEERLKTPEVGKLRELVIEYAKEKLGKPYVWGGESDSEGGYDCSGLLYYAFKKAGVDMPRVSYTQAARGKRVSLDKLKPGDLVAWENNPSQPGADHIALYIGNGQVLEAARRGTNVRIRKLGANEGAWGVKLNY